MGKRTVSVRDVDEEAEGGSAGGPEHKRTKDETDSGDVMVISADDFECVICFDLMVDPVVAKCGHDFCKLCLEKVCSSTNRRYQMPSCPVCRTPLATRHSSSEHGVCIRMKDMIDRLFPRRSKQRRAEVEQERVNEEAKQRREAAEREANRAQLRAAAAARLAMPMDITRLVDSTMQQVADGWGMGFFQGGLHMAQPPLGGAASAAAAAAAAGGSGPTSAAAAAAAASLPGSHGAAPQTQHMSLTEQVLQIRRELARNRQVLQQSRERLNERQRAAAASASARAAADPEDGGAALAGPMATGLEPAAPGAWGEPPGGWPRLSDSLQSGVLARRSRVTRTHGPRLPYGMGPGLPQLPYGLRPAAADGGAHRWAAHVTPDLGLTPDLGRVPPPGGSEAGDRAGGRSAGAAAGGQRSARGPPLQAGGVAGATGNDVGEAAAAQGPPHFFWDPSISGPRLGFPSAAAAAAGGHPTQYTRGRLPPPFLYGPNSPPLTPSHAAEPGAAGEPRSRLAALGAVPAARQPVSVAYYGFDHGELGHAEQASAVMRRPVMGPTDTWMTPPLYMHPQPVVQAAPAAAAAAAAAAVTGPGAQSIRRSSPLVSSLREVRRELQAVQRARSDMEVAAAAAGAAAAAVASANLSPEGAYAAAAADLAQMGRSGGAEHQHSRAPAPAAAADSQESLDDDVDDAVGVNGVGGVSPTGLHGAASDAAEAYAAAAADLAGTSAGAEAAAPTSAAGDAHRGNDSAAMGFAAAPMRGTMEAGRRLASNSAPGRTAAAAAAASPRHAANGCSTLPLFRPAAGSDDEVNSAGPDRSRGLDAAAIESRMTVLWQLQQEQQRRSRRYRDRVLRSAPPRHDGVQPLGADRADPGAPAPRSAATRHPAAAEGPGAAGRQEAGQQPDDPMDLLGLLMDPLDGGHAAAQPAGVAGDAATAPQGAAAAAGAGLAAAAMPQTAFLAGAGPAVLRQPQALLVAERRGPAVVQRPAEDLQQHLAVTPAAHGVRRRMLKGRRHANADRVERRDGQQQGLAGQEAQQAPHRQPNSREAALALSRRATDRMLTAFDAPLAPMLHDASPAPAAAAGAGGGGGAAAAALAAAHLEPDAHNRQLLARSSSASDSDAQPMGVGLRWDQGDAGAVASAVARPASIPAAPAAQAAATGGVSAEPLGFDALLPDADNEAALHRANSPHARAPRDFTGGRQRRRRGTSSTPDLLLAFINELDSAADAEAQLQPQPVQQAQVMAPAAQAPPAPAAAQHNTVTAMVGGRSTAAAGNTVPGPAAGAPAQAAWWQAWEDGGYISSGSD